MNLQEQINQDIKTAMKAKESAKLEALRFLKSLFIQNNTSTKPTDDLSVVVSHVKKLNDSLAMYESNPEAQAKIAQEITYLESYLPKPLTEAEVMAFIDELKSKGVNQMGAIMKELKPFIHGRFDGRKASELVKNSLK